MRSNRGFTLFELLVVMALITILSAISIPVMMESVGRNAAWTASEQIGSQIRQARLKAISRNRNFRVRFDCPAVGQFRVLVVTGDPTVDNAADRCSNTVQFDSGIYQMPERVTYTDPPPLLEVTSRGLFTSDLGIPTTIGVTYNGVSTRNLTVSLTGQITFDVY
ncbi:MAG TPA: GspH/FimT family pseudopilin [Vicinamibacterales bacterium]|nr:GspH/FimT family pseudopilin [Vicinamibacterales bacterium]